MNWRLAIGLLCANALGGIAAVWTLQVDIWGIDDAYIYFVYAKNFLLSGEFVYNLGGERVEGFSSPLWMLVCIGVMALAPEPQVLLAVLTTLLTTSIAYQAVRYSEALLANPEPGTGLSLHLGSWLLLACLYANPSWFTWNIASLMETPLWGCLITLTAIRLLFIVRRGQTTATDAWVLPVLLVLLILCRPEAPLWAGWFLFAWGLALRSIGCSLYRIARQLAPAALLCTITLTLLFSIRLNYFGYLFANTYYAKMSPNLLYNLSEGVIYLLEFSAKNGIAVVGVILTIWGLGKSVRVLLPGVVATRSLRACTELFLLTGTVATGIVAALITGGDKFGGYRFYQSFMPVLYLVVLYFCRHEWPRVQEFMARRPTWLNGMAAAMLTGLVVTNLITASWSNHNRTNLAIEFNIAEQMRLSARLMNHIFESADAPLPSVAVIPAGGFKFDAAALTYDLMGLNLTPMAHSSIGREGIKNHAAFDPEIFWSLGPQVLGARVCGFESTPWRDDRFEWRVLKGLPGSPRFVAEFSYAHVRVDGEPNWLCGYLHNNLIASLQARPALEIHTIQAHEPGSHSRGIDPELETFNYRIQ